jgi:hypothetical protein
MSEAVHYCRESSAYGFKYLVEPRFSLLERFFWAAVVFAGMVIAVISIQSSYLEWDLDPVQTTVDTTAFPIQSVPFPAVTICLDSDARSDGSQTDPASLLKALYEESVNKKFPFLVKMQDCNNSTDLECVFGYKPMTAPLRYLVDKGEQLSCAV